MSLLLIIDKIGREKMENFTKIPLKVTT
uniref:Uncharacterized protein n=1 Tax=Rhizophora mucronata TaxID=61149 RepID=A0A2P2N7N9_RHIMU